MRQYEAYLTVVDMARNMFGVKFCMSHWEVHMSAYIEGAII